MKTFNITPISEWLPKARRPYIIAGPCSAESEKQVISTAKELAKDKRINVLRAGIWKPRTRPNTFEGVGEKGLQWLKKAGEEIGLPVTTEVANAQHAEACLKAGIDILWIGARTTVNPFSVQEIADVLKGVDIPVMVKNPINPDLELWMGAIERLQNVGITKLAAIHRGFSSFEKTPFRNAPMWEIPIELKTKLPELEIFCDPSHIAGNRDLLSFICQKAIDLDMGGIMIEAHISPQTAMSDAAQQVTPSRLSNIFDELTVRKASTQNDHFKGQLEKMRALIDELDEEIIQKLSTRMGIAEKIGEYKKENNVTILQVKRWDEILKKRLALAEALGLGEEFTRKLLQSIHKESIRKQTEVMNREMVN